MDIFFTDPDDIPLPPAEVRIRHLTAEPWADKERVRVYLELTPFQKHPDGEITITNQSGEEVVSISFIETIDPKMEFTVHLRHTSTVGEFTIRATVFYPQQPDSEEEEHNLTFEPRDNIIVDQAEMNFTIED